MRRFAILFGAILASLFILELTPPGQAVVRPWTALVAEASSRLVRAFDGEARAYGTVLANDRSGFAVSIEAGCNGVEAMLVLLAGILAFPAPWGYRLVGLAAGFAAIQALNVVRIVSLFYLGQWNLQWFEWAHMYAWQALIMLDAMLVWVFWVRAMPQPATGAAA